MHPRLLITQDLRARLTNLFVKDAVNVTSILADEDVGDLHKLGGDVQVVVCVGSLSPHMGGEFHAVADVSVRVIAYGHNTYDHDLTAHDVGDKVFIDLQGSTVAGLLGKCHKFVLSCDSFYRDRVCIEEEDENEDSEMLVSVLQMDYQLLFDA